MGRLDEGAGHLFDNCWAFFPLGNQIIYMFSVPLFFFISGFLSKTNETEKVFWSKLFRSLVLPLLIICFLFGV